MSRNALLEKIKRAEEVAASEVEKAEKERTTAMNRIPLDQEALLKEKKDKAEKESKSEVDEAMKELNKAKQIEDPEKKDQAIENIKEMIVTHIYTSLELIKLKQLTQ